MDERSGKTYVLLPVHNRRPVTVQFVQCLLDQVGAEFHLVLIDDGSSDGSAEAVVAMVPTATVLRGNGSWWWAGSLQQGYRWLGARKVASDDLVLIANDDTRFDQDFLARARTALSGSRNTLLLARLYSAETQEFVELGVHVDWEDLSFKGVKDPGQVNCLSTRGLFLYAAEFQELGGFHPHLLPHYGSDYEFTMRARNRGFELTSAADVRLWYDPTTTGIRSPSATSMRMFLRTTLSRRSVSNPVFWTSLVILACPRRLVLRNIIRVWRGFFRDLVLAGRRRPD